MSASEVIIELRKKLGISRRRLALLLGFQGNPNIIWFYEKKERFPSHPTWMKICEVAATVEMTITTDMMIEK